VFIVIDTTQVEEPKQISVQSKLNKMDSSTCNGKPKV